MEFTAADVASDLPDLTDIPLADLADLLAADDFAAGLAAAETVRRVAPRDGTRLLVAASFNSAI